MSSRLLHQPTNQATPYYLGFTAVSLRPELSRIVAEAFLISNDWDAARSTVLSENSLQSKSPNSAIRIERELRQRLQTLTPNQLHILAHAAAADRAAMSWLSMIKFSAFPFEFAADLLRDKLEAHDPILRPSDYEGFVEDRSAGHPELAGLAESTRTKVRRVLLRMLLEAGILIDGPLLGKIQRPVLSPDAQHAIFTDDLRWLAGFLVPDIEIDRAR